MQESEFRFFSSALWISAPYFFIFSNFIGKNYIIGCDVVNRRNQIIAGGYIFPGELC